IGTDGQVRARLGRIGDQLRAGREVEHGPLGARDRPVLLVADDELLPGMADVELHARLPVPAVLLSLEEEVEEALLQVDAIVGIVVRPMLYAVNLEPFLLRGGTEEALVIAARMQGL